MPHLTLEYSSNLQALKLSAVLRELNQALLASGQFQEADIKSRAVERDAFVVGVAAEERGFVHARIEILSGRTAEVKQGISRSIAEVLRLACAGHVRCPTQVTVSIIDIDRDSYSKILLGS